MSIIFLYCYVMCIWLQIKKSVYFIIQFIFVIIYDSIAPFGVIHGSHCTISANFYLYLLYFQQKKFQFQFQHPYPHPIHAPYFTLSRVFPINSQNNSQNFLKFYVEKNNVQLSTKTFFIQSSLLFSSFTLSYPFIYLWVIQLKIKI